MKEITELKRSIEKQRQARKEHVQALNLKHKVTMKTCERLELHVLELYSLCETQKVDLHVSFFSIPR